MCAESSVRNGGVSEKFLVMIMFDSSNFSRMVISLTYYAQVMKIVCVFF